MSREKEGNISKMALRTFLVVVTLALEDADHDDGHDNNKHGRNNRHHQIKVGHEYFHRIVAAVAGVNVREFAGRRNGA